jgi:hypothetical protein
MLYMICLWTWTYGLKFDGFEFYMELLEIILVAKINVPLLWEDSRSLNDISNILRVENL